MPAPDDLGRLIADSLPCRVARAARFLPLVEGEPGLVAVVLYGSQLAGLEQCDSETDLYAIVDSPRAFHRTPLRKLLGAVLPPSTYHLRVVDGAGIAGAKLCVITVAQLERETSAAAADLHHLGRFSKRVGVLRDPSGRGMELVAAARRSALETLAGHVLALLPERFTLDEFALALLAISYRGEPRVVEPRRAERLFAAGREHYRAVCAALLRGRPGIARLDGDAFAQPPPDPRERAAALALIARSRRRALLRWPKLLLTFDGWLDYALAKIARHTGRELALSPRARRHPLIFGWPELLSLRRQGLLR
jgi:hypothetical protein